VEQCSQGCVVISSVWHSHGLDSENINEGQGRDRMARLGKAKMISPFADDIAIFEGTWEEMQTITLALEEEAKKFGLVINMAKTNVMTG